MPYHDAWARSLHLGVQRACCVIFTVSWRPETSSTFTGRRAEQLLGIDRPNEFFAILFALLLEQVRPLARRIRYMPDYALGP